MSSHNFVCPTKIVQPQCKISPLESSLSGFFVALVSTCPPVEVVNSNVTLRDGASEGFTHYGRCNSPSTVSGLADGSRDFTLTCQATGEWLPTDITCSGKF